MFGVCHATEAIVHCWVKLYQKTRLFQDYADFLSNWEQKYLLLRPVSRRALESTCLVPSNCSDEMDLDDSRLVVVPTYGVAHRSLFHHFWSRDHYDNSAAYYSFTEEDLNPAGRRRKSDLEEFVANFELEWVPDPRYPGKS